MSRRTVSDSVNPPVAGLEAPVDDDAAAIVTNSRGFEAELVDHRSAPGGNQQMASSDSLVHAGGFDRGCYCTGAMRDPDDFYTAANDDAFPFKTIEENSNAFRIIMRKRLRYLKYGHRTSEPPECLSHFETDGSCAYDDEMLRPVL